MLLQQATPFRTFFFECCGQQVLKRLARAQASTLALQHSSSSALVIAMISLAKRHKPCCAAHWRNTHCPQGTKDWPRWSESPVGGDGWRPLVPLRRDDRGARFVLCKQPGCDGHEPGGGGARGARHAGHAVWPAGAAAAGIADHLEGQLDGAKPRVRAALEHEGTQDRRRGGHHTSSQRRVAQTPHDTS